MLAHNLRPFPAPPPGLLTLACRGVGGHTLIAYLSDWHHFADWSGKPDSESMAKAFLSGGQGAAQAAAMAYRQHLIDAGYAPATINRRIASLRYLVKYMRMSGLITWSIEIKSVTSVNMRDTRGPGAEAMVALFAATTDPRETLLLRLLHDMALRRAEVVGLELADWQEIPIPPSLWILGKGQLQKIRCTAPTSVQTALKAWLAVRGDAPGSLLGYGYANIQHVIDRLARHAKIYPTHAHGLRHAGITRAIELTQGNVRKVQRFARHSKIETTLRYDDNRTDAFGEVSEMLGNDKPT